MLVPRLLPPLSARLASVAAAVENKLSNSERSISGALSIKIINQSNEYCEITTETGCRMQQSYNEETDF